MSRGGGGTSRGGAGAGRQGASPAAPALEVAGLEVPFGTSPGLRDIAFAVRPGERLVLAGASGAGKTTLLRAIAGLAPVAAGRVRVGGRDVAALPPERRDAVYLHQTPLLFPHLSVFENVAFPLRVRRMDDAEIRRRARHALELVRLADFGDRRPRTLSGGQRHRIALARAIVARPKALLLDEPLTSLDPSLRQEVREAIVALQGEYGHALVVVTHDLDEAGALADRIGVLLDGRLARLAPPAELFARPGSLAVARFLGVPNELPAEPGPEGAVRTPLGTLPPRPAERAPTGGADPARRDATGPAKADAAGPAEAGAAAPPSIVAFWPAALRRCQAGVEAVVLSVEHRPERTHARIRVEGRVLTMAVDAGAPPGAGEGIRVALDPDQVMRFPAP